MIEMLVALHVTDDAGYSEYRRQMTPLLEAAGGSFGYDFRVSEVLRAPTSEPINRVFTIRFPSESAKEAFFSSPEYLSIRGAHFEAAVSSTTRISSWEADS